MLEPNSWTYLLAGFAFLTNFAVVRFVLTNFTDVQHAITEEINRLPLVRRPWARHLRDPAKQARAIARYRNRLFRAAITLPLWLIRHAFHLVLAFVLLLGFSLSIEIIILSFHEAMNPGQLFGTEADTESIVLYVVFVTVHEMTAGFFDIFPQYRGFENPLVLDSDANFIMALTMVSLKFTVASILATEIGGDLVSTMRHLPGSVRFAFQRYHDGIAGEY